MTDEVTITLPAHAIRYLRQMCDTERSALADLSASTFMPNLQLQAAFDSLNAIESALPND